MGGLVGSWDRMWERRKSRANMQVVAQEHRVRESVFQGYDSPLYIVRKPCAAHHRPDRCWRK